MKQQQLNTTDMTTENTDIVKSTTVYSNDSHEQVALQVRRNAKGRFYVTLENGVRLTSKNYRKMGAATDERTHYGHKHTQSVIDYAHAKGVADRSAKIKFRMEVVA